MPFEPSDWFSFSFPLVHDHRAVHGPREDVRVSRSSTKDPSFVSPFVLSYDHSAFLFRVHDDRASRYDDVVLVNEWELNGYFSFCIYSITPTFSLE